MTRSKNYTTGTFDFQTQGARKVVLSYLPFEKKNEHLLYWNICLNKYLTSINLRSFKNFVLNIVSRVTELLLYIMNRKLKMFLLDKFKFCVNG